MTTSYFTTGVSALFEMATADADRILPNHLQPIEVRPQRSILNVTAFHFHESPVGPHAELLLSVVVPPLTRQWTSFPKAGFFPFLSATTSAVSRRDRRQRLRIPTYPHDIDVHFVEWADRLTVRIVSEEAPVLDVTVTQHEWSSATHLLHTFMVDGERRLKADLQIAGRYSMHEYERGHLTLHRHPITSALTLEEVSPYPFREHWLKDGYEVYHTAEPI